MDDPFPPVLVLTILSNHQLSWGDIGISLLWVIGLLSINAFFVAVEFSLVSARRSRMIQLAGEGNHQANLVKTAQEHLERALSTTQLGITIASILLGWIGVTQVAQLVQAGLVWIYHLMTNSTVDGVSTQLLPSLALVVTFVGLTYLQLVWGELLPKTLAIVYAEPISLRLAWLNDLVIRLLAPFVEVPRFTSRLVLQLFGVPIPDQTSLYSTMTAEELQVLIASVETGDIEEEERELLANVFEFGETVASEVMVPRTSLDAVSLSATVQDVLIEVGESNHSRYPVYQESLDDIKGMINIKTIISALAKEDIQLESSIETFIQPAHFVHENKLIAELLPEMQQHHQAMIVVVDEFGGTAGVITIKDLVEEIVGNLSDEASDNGDEPDIEKIDELTYTIQAQISIEDLKEKLDLDLPNHDDYQTLGGFLIYQMQKIPRVGEKLIYQGLEFQVLRIEGPRLDRIKLTYLANLPDSTLGSLPSS